MAFTPVLTNVKYFKYKDCKKGDVLIASGTYKSSDEGKFGVQHTFEEDDGGTTVLNKAQQLNWQLENKVPLGSKCNIVYDGVVKMTKGDMMGKDAHQFLISIDKGAPLAAMSTQRAATVAPESLDISL